MPGYNGWKIFFVTNFVEAISCALDPDCEWRYVSQPCP